MSPLNRSCKLQNCLIGAIFCLVLTTGIISAKGLPSKTGHYTGLVIDSVGLLPKGGILPRIYDQTGRLIYDDKEDFPNMVASASSLQAALRDKRVGSQPLVVYTIALKPAKAGNSSNIVVSKTDADAILRANQKAHFLEKGSVLFVITSSEGADAKEQALREETVMWHEKQQALQRETAMWHDKKQALKRETALWQNEEARLKREIALRHEKELALQHEAAVRHSKNLATRHTAAVRHQKALALQQEAALRHEKAVAAKRQETLRHEKELALEREAAALHKKELALKHQEALLHRKEKALIAAFEANRTAVAVRPAAPPKQAKKPATKPAAVTQVAPRQESRPAVVGWNIDEKTSQKIAQNPSLLNEVNAAPPRLIALFNSLSAVDKAEMVKQLHVVVPTPQGSIDNKEAYITGQLRGQNFFDLLRNQLSQERRGGSISEEDYQKSSEIIEISSSLTTEQRSMFMTVLEIEAEK